MSKAEKYEAKTEKLLETIIADNNFELVDVEYVKEHGSWFLRTYIDKDGGITIDDCELVSRALSDLLDDNDFIEDSYILEVSSPGLGRQLKKDRDFAKNIGEEVDIKLYRAINKNKEITGILINYDKDKITLELKEEEIIEILRSEIAMVRLTFDF
ncbi:MAG TPA: ribosome maturation factor RimP [Clostridiales bacterium]|nr:ribosome maturation factor RimP [Clostridiales bacterium]